MQQAQIWRFLGLGLLALGLVDLVLAGAGPVVAQADPTPPAGEAGDPGGTDEPGDTAQPAGTAQPGEQPIPRVHLVQPGETLFGIAQQYGTTVEALQLVNNIQDSDLLFAGQELLIPGAEGDLVVTAVTVEVGDTLAGVAARFNTSTAAVAAANDLINPILYGGQRLVVLSRTGSAAPETLFGAGHLVAGGETLIGLAARYGVTPYDLAAANGLRPAAPLFPGQRLRIPGDGSEYQFLPGPWTALRVRPVPLVAGETVSIYVASLLDGEPTGRLGEQPLRFAPLGDGFVALVGLEPGTPSGRLELNLGGSGDRPWPPFHQPVAVTAVDYGLQAVVVPPELDEILDPELRAAEDDFLTPIFARYTPEAYWDGLFQAPVTVTLTSSPYGVLRSYNGGPYDVIHTGIDYPLPAGTPVLAPAAGVVVFADTLRLRGRTVIVDHGLGVMTAYYHLAEIAVVPGERLAPRQLLGAVGSSGLSSGPHLHWDVRVGNIPVNGQQWLEETLP